MNLEEKKIEVSLTDLDYTLNELNRFRKETLKLRKVERNYDRLIKMTDIILKKEGIECMGDEHGPVQILEKLVFVKKAEASVK